MFLRKATLNEIQYVANNLTDYDLMGDLRKDGNIFSVIHDDKPVGILQIVKHDTFSTIDVAILPKWRSKWITRRVFQQMYTEAFKGVDRIVVQSDVPKIGTIMAKEGYKPYAVKDGMAYFVLYKHNLRKEWKVNG